LKQENRGKSVSSKNRSQLFHREIATIFFASIHDQAAGKRLLPDEYFIVNGALTEA